MLDSILELLARNNPRLGITGMLCFTNEVFVQVIEAGRDEVCLLLKYSLKAELKLFNCSGRVARALLDELMATGSILSRGK